jgi:hypothetical protein
MSRRTQIRDYEKIEQSEDLERVIIDKRKQKRANKKKGKRRNRHYQKVLLAHLIKDHKDQD